eukprot:tig00020780_g13758.t1
MAVPEREISDIEAQVYDRQIRLWGVEAQRAMSSASVLVCGVTGLCAEAVKNLVLAGVGRLTLLDHRAVSSDDLHTTFVFAAADVGKLRVQAALSRFQALNPLVEVRADSDGVASKTPDFFSGFTVVCAFDMPLPELIALNNICRKQRVKFLSAIGLGLYGLLSQDLLNHDFIEELTITRKDEKFTEPKEHVIAGES